MLVKAPTVPMAVRHIGTDIGMGPTDMGYRCQWLRPEVGSHVGNGLDRCRWPSVTDDNLTLNIGTDVGSGSQNIGNIGQSLISKSNSLLFDLLDWLWEEEVFLVLLGCLCCLSCLCYLRCLRSEAPVCICSIPNKNYKPTINQFCSFFIIWL